MATSTSAAYESYPHVRAVLLPLITVLIVLSILLNPPAAAAARNPAANQLSLIGPTQTGTDAARGNGPGICWTSHSSPDAASSSQGEDGGSTWREPRGVTVHGSGCSECTVGSTCSFVVSVEAPSSWRLGSTTHTREINAVLAGPSLVLGEVSENIPLDGSSFTVTYLPWDAGDYVVTLTAPCLTLDIAAAGESSNTTSSTTSSSAITPDPAPFCGTSVTASSVVQLLLGDEAARKNSVAIAKSWPRVPISLPCHVLATFSLRVTHTVSGGAAEAAAAAAATEAGDVAASGLDASGTAVGGDLLSEFGQLMPSICASGSAHGRWVASGANSLRWERFSCGPHFSPSQWVDELNRHGIWEIDFIGDSHQRTLMHHLLFLVSGKLDWPQRSAHRDLKYSVQSANGGSLTINFWWVAGIYESGSTFGCNQLGRTSPKPRRPPVPATGDVIIVDAGYWSGQQCHKPAKAFAASLPSFLMWLEPLKMSEKKPLLIYRSTPPRATDHQGCHSLTNVFIREANAIARQLVGQSDFLYFDSWMIEAPRYLDHCPRDHHYSCVARDKVDGDISEAVLDSLVHFMLRYRKQHSGA